MKQLAIKDQQTLDTLYDMLVKKKSTYIGYPNSQLLSNETLTRFLNLTINNVGDPFRGNNGMNTFELEKEVVEFIGTLLKLGLKEMWGYVTNGGTEGNTYGLYLGRETYPDGICYFSRDSHYSIPKGVRVLGMRSAVIESQQNGEMDYEHLEQTLKPLRHYPVIINANIGTTMKGGIDNVLKIKSVLEKLSITRYYIHGDAALFGVMLPFLEHTPSHDFTGPFNSIAISGHKFLGSPIPCGVVIARKEVVSRISGSVEYIGSVDSTLSGSRDGFSVLILWQTIKRLGLAGLKELVTECMDNTDYAIKRLRAIDWPSWANAHSNIVVIKRPPDSLISKWHLATEGSISHLIIMPGVTPQVIDGFIEDLLEIRREKQPYLLASRR